MPSEQQREKKKTVCFILPFNLVRAEINKKYPHTKKKEEEAEEEIRFSSRTDSRVTTDLRWL